MDAIHDNLNETCKPFSRLKLKPKYSLHVQPVLDTSLSTKSILGKIGFGMKPSQSTRHVPLSTRLSHSNKLITTLSKKSVFPKTQYKSAISGLDLPQSGISVVTALPTLPNWAKSELSSFEEVFFVSSNEKPSIDPSSSEVEGEMKIMLGDDLYYRYEILSFLGKGTFGQVVKVLDHKEKKELAMKIVKSKPRYSEQAQTEIEILKFLKEKHADVKAHIVTFESSFIFRKHFCISFELLHICLYNHIKNNNFRGLAFPNIKKIAYQTLKGLAFLAGHDLIHCDLKPENILLVSEKSHSVKMIDFGSSCFSSRQSFTYIQSRFYRAPEIVLGMKYSPAIDIWSFGCILVELFTGIPIFPCESEKDLVSAVAEVIGEPLYDFIYTGTRSGLYFNADGTLKPFKNSKGRRRYPNTRPLRSILKGADEEFVELVSRCLKWDPKDRITAEDALKYGWIAEVMTSPKVFTRYCKISVEDIIRHNPKLKKIMNHQIKHAS
jgi:dual specificity tyrosine-phosphorylation-regulated kinase 2/3/4